jgi:magnesium and cobalt exporter, CNNM family
VPDFAIELIVIVILILANGFFALAELSLVSAKRSGLMELAESGNEAAKRALNLIQKPEQFLAAVQIGITFVGTLAAVFGGATLVDFLRPYFEEVPIEFISEHARIAAVVLVVVLISLLSLILGELAPKYIALTHSEKLALRVSRPITAMAVALRFVFPIITGPAKIVARIFGVKEITRGSPITELDVHLLVAEGRKSGIFDDAEQELVRSALDFADTTAREAMTHRADIVGFRDDTSIDEMIDVMIEKGYSRYPVYHESIDKIIGVVMFKNVVRRQRENEDAQLNDVINPAMFIPDSMELAELLKKMQRKRQHMAICLDEFGGTAGIITMEDILEEIVGEIQDETDDEIPEFSAKNDRVAFISSTLRPDQLNEQFGSHLAEERSTTVAGMLVSARGAIPEKQERVRLNDVIVTVLELSGNRILRMKVEKISPAIEPNAPSDSD